MDTTVGLGTVTPRAEIPAPLHQPCGGGNRTGSSGCLTLPYPHAGIRHLQLLRCQLSHQPSISVSVPSSVLLYCCIRNLYLNPWPEARVITQPRGAQLAGRGCRDLPFPHNTQHPSWMRARLAQHHPCIIPSIAPASPPAPRSAGHAEGAAGTAYPPLPSSGTVHAASQQTDKVHFTFPSSAGENCNKDKV